MKNIYAVPYHRFVEILKARSIDDSNVHLQNTAFIQIGGTDLETSGEYQFYLKDNTNVIGLRFDDCEEEVRVQIIGGLEYVGQYPIKKEQARQLFDFIERNKDKETFLVHCRAGQNRSGGVVTFLGEYFGISYNKIKEMSPKIFPLTNVVSLLRECWEESKTK